VLPKWFNYLFPSQVSAAILPYTGEKGILPVLVSTANYVLIYFSLHLYITKQIVIKMSLSTAVMHGSEVAHIAVCEQASPSPNESQQGLGEESLNAGNLETINLTEELVEVRNFTWARLRV
jgi:hypothetical protein